MRKVFTLPLLLFWVAACAQPNYITKNNINSSEKLSSSCEAQFKSNNQFCVQITWITEPTQNTKGQFLLKTFRSNLADNTPILDDLKGELHVDLWMPSMGHGSSPVSLQKLDTGTYKVSDVFFIMPGEWEIRFKLKDSTGQLIDEAIYSLRI